MLLFLSHSSPRYSLEHREAAHPGSSATSGNAGTGVVCVCRYTSGSRARAAALAGGCAGAGAAGMLAPAPAAPQRSAGSRLPLLSTCMADSCDGTMRRASHVTLSLTTSAWQDAVWGHALSLHSCQPPQFACMAVRNKVRGIRALRSTASITVHAGCMGSRPGAAPLPQTSFRPEPA
jgi:hypothetical protein